MVSIEQSNIASLPKSTVPSHSGRLVLANFAQKTVALVLGRQHLYEGYSASQVCTMVYILHQLGATQLIISNAAGALNPGYAPGDVMLIEDHINLTGHNPLIGLGDENNNHAFIDMSQAYRPQISEPIVQRSNSLGQQVHRGIYCGVLGPSLETSAERRMMRALGADAVGMSTVMEVIAANHCGMDVLGLSAITNLATGDAQQQVDTIEDVLHNAAIAGQKIGEIVAAVLDENDRPV
jgi:purine-nucleoside phosphorylase